MDFKKLTIDQLKEFIRLELLAFDSKVADMQKGKDYYKDKHDICNKKRIGIGKDGKPSEIYNLPNSKIMDNQYSKLVDQKVNYLLSKPPKITNEEDKNNEKELISLFDSRFMRTLNKIALDTYNCGIGWLCVSLENDEFTFEKMDPKELIPIWKNNNHEGLSALIRKKVYKACEDGKFKEKTEIEFYDGESIKIFDYNHGELEFKEEKGYLKKEDKQYKLGKIPFVYFKSPEEQPLLFKVKALQDALNDMMSNFVDNMLEDPRNTILVLKNYGGEDLGQFRSELAKYGAVKVESDDGTQGGVETLEVEVNHENYKFIIETLKKAIVENGKGVDAKNDKSAQAPNEINIKSMYTDIDLDANKLELEFQASFEYLQEIMSTVTTGIFAAIKEKVIGKTKKTYSTIKFDRNVMVYEGGIIENLAKSDKLSDKTYFEKHPYVSDVDEELKRISTEELDRIKQFDDYDNIPFNKNIKAGGGDLGEKV